MYRVSNATKSSPAYSSVFTVNSNVTSPLAASALKVVLAVATTLDGSALRTNEPSTTYSRPGIKLV